MHVVARFPRKLCPDGLLACCRSSGPSNQSTAHWDHFQRISALFQGVMTVLLLLQLLSVLPPAEAGQTGPQGCLSCHQGIEPIGQAHEDVSCGECHGGKPGADLKEAAHEGMHRNPGDLSILEKTCGECHDKETENVKKSLHATSAGIISGARYLWAAQKVKNALYAVRHVIDNDGDVPAESGALKELSFLPRYDESKEPIDDYLRNQCLRCHLWTDGQKRAGDYRSGGCSACHVPYAEDGLSNSGDPTIPKDEPGHPIRHKITTTIADEQCVHCHNRGGRTGVSYLGMMESDGYGTPFRPDGSRQPKLHGKHYNFLRADLHRETGIACIDCHTLNDLHGDGNIYSKREQAVEIECTDCHGNLTEYSRLETSRGSRLKNLEKQNDGVILTSKSNMKRHMVPQVRALDERGVLPVAMQITGHIERMECYACHASWAPQCYGCHVKMDKQLKGNDWIDASEETTFAWEESRSYLRWETPLLGINSEGKVSPFVTGCQVIFTEIDKSGQAAYINKVFVTAGGHSGIAHNPVQPHTISRKARNCESCHSNLKTLGLGYGHYVSRLNGINIPFELERIVDEDGNQIQATSHVGARPFNKAELEKIKRINVCVGCHKDSTSAFWEKVKEKWDDAKTNKSHNNLLHMILQEGSR